METIELDSRNDLTTGVIWKKLLIFFFPILLGTLFQQFYNTVDAIVVGNFVGPEALAAVGGSPALLINLVVGFFVGLAGGATVIISQYFGAGDGEGLSRTVHTAIAFCLIAGVILTVAGWFLAPWALRAVHTPEDIFEDSLIYLRIYFLGTVFSLLFNVGSGILRAVGDSKHPLYYLIICALLNIALDLLFVIAFRMGVAGVAWATIISLAVSAMLILINLARSETAYRLELRRIRIHPECFGRILTIGIPAGIQSTMYSLSNLIIQAAVNDLGTTVAAAWTTTGKLDGVFWSVSNAFGAAISAFVGQCFGAGKYDRMHKSIRTCLLLCIGSAAVISSGLLAIAKWGFRIFTDDTQVIAYCIEMLWYFAPFYVVWAFIEVISNSLRGAGDAVRPMLITCIGVCGLRVLYCALVIPYWHTVMSVSLCYPFTWVITAAAFTIYYYKSGWLDRCIRASAERNAS